MIPKSFIQAWSNQAPWPDYNQIEQDLIISRALCDLFNTASLKENIAFRGGTAINKLLFAQPLRYSEDIDLVQINPAPIGSTLRSTSNRRETRLVEPMPSNVCSRSWRMI